MHPIPNFKIYKAKSDRTKERDRQFLSHELPEHKDKKKKVQYAQRKFEQFYQPTITSKYLQGFPWWSSGLELTFQCRW